MRLPVRKSQHHKGTLLELDTEQETLILVGTDGQTLGRTTWDAVIDHILATSKPSQPAPVRQHPRAAVSIDVRYQTEGGEMMESRTTGIGGGGLFIESAHPFPPGTLLNVEFVLPDGPRKWLRVTGRVAWVCERPDQYHFHPGMGIKFEEIAEETRERIMALVNKLIETSDQS